MPAKDIYHETVRRALIKDGWTITADPLKLKWEETDLFVDLGAEKFILAEKGNRRIAVEIKSFISKSKVADLENALGQYILYFDVLEETEPERKLYLAISSGVFEKIFASSIGRLPLKKGRLLLLVFDENKEEIIQWIP
jgi:hypothetical protein